MTSLGHTAHQVNTAHAISPGWRPLTGLALLVVAAHALVLQASAAHLGSRTDDGGKTFTTTATPATLTTRRIEAAPAATTAPAIAPIIPTAPAAPKAVKITQKSLNTRSNQPLAQQIPSQAAPETVAPAAIQSAAEPASLPVDVAVAESTAASTPSQVITEVVTARALSSDTAVTAVTAVSLPGSVRLQYKVIGLSKNLNYQATSELNWKTDGDTYDAVMKVSAFLVGSRSMTSVGKITSNGLAPKRFADKFRSELAAHFEADKGKIVFSANTPDAPWIFGAQDRVSVFMQLAGMLAANPAGYPTGSDMTFLTIGPREADTWTFVIEAEENLDLMNAPMAALKLTRKPRKEFDQKVEIWFAPSLGYLPVRSRITQHGGDFIDQQLTEISKSM